MHQHYGHKYTCMLFECSICLACDGNGAHYQPYNSRLIVLPASATTHQYRWGITSCSLLFYVLQELSPWYSQKSDKRIDIATTSISVQWEMSSVSRYIDGATPKINILKLICIAIRTIIQLLTWQARPKTIILPTYT